MSRKAAVHPALDQAKDCERCATPTVFWHEDDGEQICVTCFLHEVGQGAQVDITDAIEVMRERSICAYCGEWAKHRETLKPTRLAEDPWELRICADCKSLAGKHEFDDFETKRSWIKSKLEQKYKHALAGPEWDDSELAELGRGIQSYVAVGEVARKIVQARLQFDFIWLVERA